MRKWMHRCVALMILAVPVQSWAVPFSTVYLLGDSLSDQGNLFLATSAVAGPANALPSSDHYYNGRFSNGPIYIDLVAQALGVASSPSLVGGNNFAYGGARTSYNTVESTVGGPFPPGLFPWSLNAEIAAFNGRGISDPNALYIVFSGSNDVADILTRGLNPAVVIPNAVNAILTGVQAFRNAGAQVIVVPNIPDLGLTPAFVGNAAASAAATFFSTQFNALLHAQLGAISGVDIIEFDTFGLLRSIVHDPTAYGLINVTSPCYSGFVAPNPSGTECANPDQFLFWDIVHPTRAVQALLAEGLLEAIPARLPEPTTPQLLLIGILVVIALRAKARQVNTAAVMNGENTRGGF